MIEVVVEGPETQLLEKIKRARGKNEEVVKVVEEMKNLRGNKWKIEKYLVLKEECIY